MFGAFLLYWIKIKSREKNSRLGIRRNLSGHFQNKFRQNWIEDKISSTVMAYLRGFILLGFIAGWYWISYDVLGPIVGEEGAHAIFLSLISFILFKVIVNWFKRLD